MVEVIKVIDLTNVPIHMKEILFAKVHRLQCGAESGDLPDRAGLFGVEVADIGR